MNLIIRTLLVLSWFLLAACGNGREQADLVILGGPIYTVDARQPTVGAVAVKDGKIVFAGAEEQGRRYISSATRVIDLKGKMMTPGFIEGHGHMMETGYNRMELDLMYAKSYAEIVEAVRQAATRAAPGQWIRGRGWHQDKWESLPDTVVKGFQTHHLLSAVSPLNPVFLVHASGHAGLANARAMEIAGVNQLSPEQLRHAVGGEGGEIIRDGLGNPTGIFSEGAMELITRHIPGNTPASDAQALALAIETCLQNGITGFHDAGVSRADIAIFREFRQKGKLKVRVYAMVSGGDSELLHEWLDQGPEIDPAHFLTIRSIKLSCDGALGSRGAWLLEPYSDRPGFYGMATTPMDTVLSIARQALKRGFQLCCHAIGDRANREVLDQYETAFEEHSTDGGDHRFRIEHAQHLHPTDIPRFAKMGVIPAMQAIHLSSDRPWAIARLGEARIRDGAYAWQSLLRTGARIVNGTDTPVEPMNPIPCFYASVTRKTLRRQPEGGYEPDQKMTREQALRSYTLDAAYSAFQEHVLGSIEKGKYADFTIFSQDMMTVPEADILETEVVMTLVGGNVVFGK